MVMDSLSAKLNNVVSKRRDPSLLKAGINASTLVCRRYGFIC
jgi:hypothetical protein